MQHNSEPLWSYEKFRILAQLLSSIFFVPISFLPSLLPLLVPFSLPSSPPFSTFLMKQNELRLAKVNELKYKCIDVCLLLMLPCTSFFKKKFVCSFCFRSYFSFHLGALVDGKSIPLFIYSASSTLRGGAVVAKKENQPRRYIENKVASLCEIKRKKKEKEETPFVNAYCSGRVAEGARALVNLTFPFFSFALLCGRCPNHE